MAWRLANSLEQLRSQINSAYPNRSKVSDGSIGDSAHAAVPSDHNPNAQSVVCALDITHSPEGGLDAHALADKLIVNRHPNVKYVISNSRIAGAWTGWGWTPYIGANPHNRHIHVSVGVGGEGTSQAGTYDDTTNWNIKEKDMVTTAGVHYIFEKSIGRSPNKGELDSRVGKYTFDYVLGEMDGSPEAKAFRASQLKEHTDKDALIAKLQSGQSVTQEEIDALIKQTDALRESIKKVNQ